MTRRFCKTIHKIIKFTNSNAANKFIEMKFSFKIVLLLLFSNVIFGQYDTIKNPKIRQSIVDLQTNFPKEVKTIADYERAFEKIMLFEKITEGEYPLIDKDFKPMIEVVKKVVLWSEKEKSLQEQLVCKTFYLMMLTKLRNFASVIDIGNELIDYKEYLTVKQINRTLVNLNFAYKSIEAYNEMIRIIPLRKKYGYLDPEGSSDLEYDLALAYYNTKNYALAARSFLIRKEYYQKRKDYLFTSSMSNNVGLCYFKLYDYKKALHYYKMAIRELAKSNGVEHPTKRKGYTAFFEAVIYSNIAKIDAENGNFESAIEANKKLLLKSKLLNEFDNITLGYINLANIYLQKNNPKLAMTFIDNVNHLSNNFILTSNVIEINNITAKILALQGKIKEATFYFNKSKKISDSLDQVLISRENILAQAKYNSAEKDKELQQSKLLIQEKESAAFKQKVALAIMLLLLLIIVLFYYKTHKGKIIIQKQAKKLNTSLLEKETLLKELHHRVKNNLQVITGLLQLQSKKDTSNAMSELLNDSQRHINSMALVHEMLYRQEDHSVVEMENYISKLTQQILESLHGKQIKSSIKIAEIGLPINKAIPLGLMISELITNSYKHAFDDNEGLISLSLTSNSSKDFSFIYADNGKGVPENFDSSNSKTMGLKLLYMLAEEMNGIVSISNQNGILVQLNFTNHEAI